MAEEIIKPETGAEEQPAAKPKRSLIPFNVKPETQERFTQMFGKATDKILRQLLDAYEHAGEHATDAPEQVQQLMTEKKRLETELSEAKQSVQNNTKTIKELEKQVSELKSQANTADKTENTEEIQKKISDLTEQISSLKKSVSEKDKRIKELEEQPKPAAQNANTDKYIQEIEKYKNTIKELENSNNDQVKQINTLQKEKKELADQVNAAEEQKRQDRKVMDGYESAKKAADEELAQARKTKAQDDKTIADLRHQLANTAFQGYSGDDDFLRHFPQLTALLLKETAEKLTEARRDGQTITPAMVLGDIFLKYTTQKRTMWFYRWVLGDDEIVAMAKTINPNIKSVSMLRRVLNIDQELN